MEAVSSFEAWPVGDPAAEAAALRAVHPARWTPNGRHARHGRLD